MCFTHQKTSSTATLQVHVSPLSILHHSSTSSTVKKPFGPGFRILPHLSGFTTAFRTKEPSSPTRQSGCISFHHASHSPTYFPRSIISGHLSASYRRPHPSHILIATGQCQRTIRPLTVGGL